jgi:hypothetical protein
MAKAAVVGKEEAAPRVRSLSDLAVSTVVTAAVTAGFVGFSESCRHWYVLPAALSGIIIGTDAVAWLRGRMNLYDPVGLFGLLGYHGFFLAPLLAAAWDFWLPYVVGVYKSSVIPSDWRDWMGWMCLLNAGGLLIYRAVRRLPLRAARGARRQWLWQLERRRFWVLLLAGIVGSAGLQVWVYARVGGLVGYILAYGANPLHAFQGSGWLFSISEAFPVLMMIGFVVLARSRPRWRSWAVIAGVLGLFFVLLMVFGGLRGNRGDTVWRLLWAVGMVHLLLRRVPRWSVYAAIPLLLAFMYVYGFYKDLYSGGLQVLSGQASAQEFEGRTGRTVGQVLLGDLARANVHSMLLYRVVDRDSDYQLAWGRTYVATAALIVPRGLWPERPPRKMKEGTEVLYGSGVWRPGGFEASTVFGLMGEGMLNFGVAAVPVAFMILGLYVGQLRRWLLTWRRDDARLLLFPFLVASVFVLWSLDSDNVVVVLLKNALVPVLVVALSSRRSIVTGKIHE